MDVIYDTCREAGLLWDEGPDVGGPVGPYVQSERMGLFKQYAEQLVADGKAYPTSSGRRSPAPASPALTTWSTATSR